MRISDWSSDVCSSDLSQPIERYGVISGMIETAENVARDFGITREQSDAYAVRSHQRAAAAWREGRFDDEVIPISITQKRGDPIVFDHDEGYRGDASIESLAAHRPPEGRVVPGGSIGKAAGREGVYGPGNGPG